MTASALNIASINPAAAAGAGASAPSASGPLAGFEALLAALFPQVDAAPQTPAAQPGQAGAPATVDALLDAAASIDGETATEAAEAAPDAAIADAQPTAGDAAAALAASLIATQPATVETTATTATDAATDTVATPTTAFGRDKTKGAPALPAILHANARAGLVEKAELAEESADISAPIAEPTLPEQAKGTPQAATARNTPSPAPTPTAPAPVAAAPDAQPDLAAPTAAVAVETPTDVPPTDAPAAAAAGLVARPEVTPTPAPAPAARTARSERTKSATDATEASDDLKPLEATDKPVHAKAAAGAAKASSAKLEPADAKVAEAETSLDAPDSAGQTEARAASQAGAPAHETAHAVRGSPETVANLAAQILKKLDGKSTRFDVELDPLGLGKVDVRIEIGAHGRITAAMTFENPQAAQDVKARATELQRMLEQAGFDLTGGMTFDVAGDRGQRQGQAWQDQAETGHAFRGQAFRAALDTAGDAAASANLGALRLRRGVNLGVDLKI